MPHAVKRIALIVYSMACAFGVYWSVRAAAGAAIYYHIKYGALSPSITKATPEPIDSLKRKLALAEQSHRLYNQNYRLCDFAANTAFSAWKRTKGDTNGVDIRVVRQWCDRGLSLYPLNRKLTYIDAELIAETSPTKALERWERYLTWHYWDPFNQYYKVELLARSGRYSEALKHLELIKGREHYQDGRRAVQNAWNEEERRMHEFLLQGGGK